MKMQDKELDALFRDRLEGLETEPSANLWAGISAGLDEGKTVRSRKPYLAIAATIVVLLTAGIIYLMQNKAAQVPIIAKKAPVKQQIFKAEKPVDVAAEAPFIASAPQAVKLKPLTVPVKKIAQPVASTVVAKQPEVKSVVSNIPQEEPVLATAQNQTNFEPVVPDDTELSPKTINTDAEPFRTRPVIAAVADQPKNEGLPAETVKKKKINSFGGLLNALVSKLDKRKDKIIEFNDADGENNVTGINLGIIKIKKEEE